ncbi:sulfate transporter family-domain-containing protein [Hyaloraphidium curvatum]|nr:sulfate transporter family-domain-containing protein [Hyaloraphidium curvatum]
MSAPDNPAAELPDGADGAPAAGGGATSFAPARPSPLGVGLPRERVNTGDFSEDGSDAERDAEGAEGVPAIVVAAADGPGAAVPRARPPAAAFLSATSPPTRRTSTISLHPPLAHLEAFRPPPDADFFKRLAALRPGRGTPKGWERDDDNASMSSHRTDSFDGSGSTAAHRDPEEHAKADLHDADATHEPDRRGLRCSCPGPAEFGALLWRWAKMAVPFLEWFPEYVGAVPPATLDPSSVLSKDRAAFRAAPWYRRGAWRTIIFGDLIAGLTIGVMVVPQGMAYATLASLPPIYGLYACLVPLFVYALFGTSREMSVGPVAINALLLTSGLYPAVAGLPAAEQPAEYLQLVISTTFLTGAFSLAAGLLRLGLAVTFVGPPVLAGFSLGSELLIGLSQLEPLLGYSTGPPQPYLVPQLVQTFSHIGQTQPAALIIGLVCIALLLTLGKHRYTRWIPRPLFVTVFATLVSWGIHSTQPSWGLPIVGSVPRGFPAAVVPRLDGATLAAVAVPSLLLAVLGFMQSISVALKFSEKRGYAMRPNQELAALGLSHLLSAFTQAMDATGSYSRTGVNAASGARTQFAGLVQVLVVVLALQVLTPLFYYIPKSALAAIVIAAVVGMFEPEAFRRMYAAKPRDFWVAVLTALVTVFAGTQYGLLAGIAISLLIIILRSSRPRTAVLGLVEIPGDPPAQAFRNVERYPEARQVPGVLVWRFDAELWFANVAWFREKLQGELARRKGAVGGGARGAADEVVVEAGDGAGTGLGIAGTDVADPPAAPVPTADDGKVRVVVLDMTAVTDVDSSGAQAILALNTTLRRSQGIEILFAGVKGPVRDVLWRATGGRILPGDDGKEAKGGRGTDAASPANGDAVSTVPDEPPADRLPDDVPLVAIEDLDGNITVVPHPAPDLLPPSTAPSPNPTRRGLFRRRPPAAAPLNATMAGGSGFLQAGAVRDLRVEQFFLTVAGAVDFARKLVDRQRAREARGRAGAA